MITKTLSPQEILKNRKLKVTVTRVDLIQMIGESTEAVAYSEIQKKFKLTDRTTLYRNLQTLQKKGIIHTAISSPTESYYALCGTNCSTNEHHHNHVHFKCTICKAVTCEKLEDKVIFSLPSFDIQKVEINMEGYCNRCLNEAKNKSSKN